jgi:hypothetical protein
MSSYLLRGRWSLFLVASAALFVARPASAGSPAACQTMNPCQTDADCGAGTLCFHDIGTTCVTTADGGQSCGPGSECLIPYQVTCQIDSDCGEGFTCNTSSGKAYSCSGNTSDVPDGAVAIACADIPKPPSSACDAGQGCPTFPGICDGGSTCYGWTEGTCTQTVNTTCTSATDCLSGWSCTSGTCEPPCYGDGSFGRPGTTGPSAGPGSGSGSKSSSGSGSGIETGGSKNIPAANPPSSSSGCDVGAGTSSPSGAWSALALAVAVAFGRARRRASRRA